jgi:hypothetical protein
MDPELKVTVTTSIGVERMLTLPGKRILCPRCEGEGRHVNPAIDEGITEEEWRETDWDDESRACGSYKVPCSKCRGEKVVIVLDYEAVRDRPRWRAGRLVTGKSRRRIRARIEAQAEADREHAAFARMEGVSGA